MSGKQRLCLKCQKPFISKGPGYRICADCNAANSYIPITERQLAATRGIKMRNGKDVRIEGAYYDPSI